MGSRVKRKDVADIRERSAHGQEAGRKMQVSFVHCTYRTDLDLYQIIFKLFIIPPKKIAMFLQVFSSVLIVLRRNLGQRPFNQAFRKGQNCGTAQIMQSIEYVRRRISGVSCKR